VTEKPQTTAGEKSGSIRLKGTFFRNTLPEADQHAVPADRGNPGAAALEKAKPRETAGRKAAGPHDVFTTTTDGRAAWRKMNRKQFKQAQTPKGQPLGAKNHHFLKGETKMKKVLSAVVLSAAMVAAAGQAQAYEDFNVVGGARGTMVGVIYTENTEIILNLGNFLTTNNTLVYDHQFSEVNKTLATVDYKSILADRNDTGSVHVAFYLDDMVTPAATPRYWDAYYATTDASHGGAAPQGTGGATTGSKSVAPFTKFNSLSVNLLTSALNASTADGGADVVTVDAGTPGFYKDQLIGQYTVGAGAYADINKLNAAWGELNLDDYATMCEIDMYLFGVRHDSKGTSSTADDANLSLGQIATLRFDKNTGAITLNASGEPAQCPVPVPAAAWLLGSGVLGLVGLRRRK